MIDRVLALQKRKARSHGIPPCPRQRRGQGGSEDGRPQVLRRQPKQFEIPEQAQAEFVVLSMDAIGAQLAVGEAEVKAWYDNHKDRYGVPEERRAAHILIGLEKLDKARPPRLKRCSGGQRRISRLRRFGQKNSDDPGSGGQGRRPRLLRRGAMVKAFEESAFALKEGRKPPASSNRSSASTSSDGRPGCQEKPWPKCAAKSRPELKKPRPGIFARSRRGLHQPGLRAVRQPQPAAEKFKLEVEERLADPPIAPLPTAPG